MKSIASCMLGVWMTCASIAALCELPPPSPAEKAKLEKAAAAKAATTKEQEEALARTQERIAREYRAKHPAAAAEHPAPATVGPVKKSDVPKSAQQPLGAQPKPYAGRTPNPEAHSSP